MHECVLFVLNYNCSSWFSADTTDLWPENVHLRIQVSQLASGEVYIRGPESTQSVEPELYLHWLFRVLWMLNFLVNASWSYRFFGKKRGPVLHRIVSCVVWPKKLSPGARSMTKSTNVRGFYRIRLFLPLRTVIWICWTMSHFSLGITCSCDSRVFDWRSFRDFLSFWLLLSHFWPGKSYFLLLSYVILHLKHWRFIFLFVILWWLKL